MTSGHTAEVPNVAEGAVKARVFPMAKSISGFERAAGNSWPKGSANSIRRSRDERGQMRKAALFGAA